MEILIVDIETTGYLVKTDAIIEIGLVLVNTDTNEIKPLFNQVVKDDLFNINKHKNAWIFQNSDLTPEEVQNAKLLKEHYEEIQSLFDKYPVTAFNKSFDVRFLETKAFKLNHIKCLMMACVDYVYLKDKRGNKKRPSVQEAYDHFFPDEKYIEKHRGADDALHEAKILLKMCEIKSQRKNNKDEK